jgi:2-dehydropantoate 2-reductase
MATVSPRHAPAGARPSFLVIGAGAIGCLVGGRLALAGCPVTLVGRPAFAALAREHGLAVVETDVQRAVEGVAAAGSIQEALLARPRHDVAIFTVKGYDTAAALQELQDATAGQVDSAVQAVLSLQNGVGNEEAIAAVVGAARVIAGSITTPVTLLAPNQVRVDRPSYTVGLSPWQPGAAPDLFDAVQAALGAAGFRAVKYPDARGLKWTKLLMNMLGNATSAILDQPPQAVFADPRLVDLEIAAWREAMAAMAASGIRPVNLGSYPFAWLTPLVRWLPNAALRPLLRSRVQGGRGGKMPSLHLDLHGGKRRSEIHWLNGAVVRAARAAGTPAPVNRLLTETLVALLDDEGLRAGWRHANARLVSAAADYRRQ